MAQKPLTVHERIERGMSVSPLSWRERVSFGLSGAAWLLIGIPLLLFAAWAALSLLF